MSDPKQRESAIRDELKRLAESHGGELKPLVVVNAARDEESPLHQSFNWDDSSAAEHWRLQQARQLIRAVVSYEQVGKKLIACRVFVSLTPDREEEGAGYRLAKTVLGDEEQRRQLLADALAEMLRFREKYRRLTELSKVFAAMDEAIESEPQQVELSAEAG